MRESLAGGELVCGGAKLVKTKLIAYNQKNCYVPSAPDSCCGFLKLFNIYSIGQRNFYQYITIQEFQEAVSRYLPDFWQEGPQPWPPFTWWRVMILFVNHFFGSSSVFILHFHFFLHFGFHFLFFSPSSFLWFFFFSKVTIHKVAKYFSNGDTITVIMMTITVIININLIINRTAIIILILITSPCIRCPVMFHVVIPLPSLLPSPPVDSLITLLPENERPSTNAQ